MLERLMKLYVMAMAYDVRSPTPHLFGPPGCGKSTSAQQLADLLGVNLHIINVSRISPLELEGVQMPVDDKEGMILRLLHATFWTQLKDGDIVLLDEFLRGFPEVYNGLLDIMTSRQVGGFKLPKVFIMAASNSTVAYDRALEDRLMHLKVPDPRSNKQAKKNLAKLLVDALGLLPEMAESYEMGTVLDTEVLPMYSVLDELKGRSAGATGAGTSVRNLIGQAQLREIKCDSLKDLIRNNNSRAMAAGKAQYVLLYSGKASDLPSNFDYPLAAKKLLGNPKLTEVQSKNLELNLQLLELESIRNEKGDTGDDDNLFGDDTPF